MTCRFPIRNNVSNPLQIRRSRTLGIPKQQANQQFHNHRLTCGRKRHPENECIFLFDCGLRHDLLSFEMNSDRRGALWYLMKGRLSISKVYGSCSFATSIDLLSVSIETKTSHRMDMQRYRIRLKQWNSGELVFPITHSVNGICRISPGLKFDCSTLQPRTLRTQEFFRMLGDRRQTPPRLLQRCCFLCQTWLALGIWPCTVCLRLNTEVTSGADFGGCIQCLKKNTAQGPTQWPCTQVTTSSDSVGQPFGSPRRGPSRILSIDYYW